MEFKDLPARVRREFKLFLDPLHFASLVMGAKAYTTEEAAAMIVDGIALARQTYLDLGGDAWRRWWEEEEEIARRVVRTDAEELSEGQKVPHVISLSDEEGWTVPEVEPLPPEQREPRPQRWHHHINRWACEYVNAFDLVPPLFSVAHVFKQRAKEPMGPDLAVFAGFGLSPEEQAFRLAARLTAKESADRLNYRIQQPPRGKGPHYPTALRVALVEAGLAKSQATAGRLLERSGFRLPRDLATWFQPKHGPGAKKNPR